MQTGREIFLKQLELMEGDGFEIEIDCLPETNREACVTLAKIMEIPEKLEEAFNAYYLEYIVESDNATHSKGVFFNEDDLNVGVYNKLYYFYRPIFDCIENKTDTFVKLYLEPSHKYRSDVVAVVPRQARKRLTVPFVAHMDNFNVCWSFFNSEKLPEDIYQEIEKIYKSTMIATKKGLLVNGIDLLNEI